jgi:uncharacterized membrane protein YqjE
MSTQFEPQRYDPARPVNDDTRSFGELLGDMVTQLSTLFRKELQLARAEMGEKVSDASGAIPGIAGGAALALAALGVLLMALAALVARLLDLPLGWGQLIVGVVGALLGYLLIRGGIAKLKATNLIPQRTADQLALDAQAAKEQVR